MDPDAGPQPEDELQQAIRQEFAEQGGRAAAPAHGGKPAQHHLHLQPPLWHKHDLSTCEEEQRSAEVVQSRDLHYMHTPGPAGRTVQEDGGSGGKAHRSSGSQSHHAHSGSGGATSAGGKKLSPPRTHAQWSLDSPAELASTTSSLPFSHHGHHLRNGARSSSATVAASRESSLTKVKTLPSSSSAGGIGSAATSGSYNHRPLLTTQVSPTTVSTHAHRVPHSSSSPSLKQHHEGGALETKRESHQGDTLSDPHSSSSSHSARQRLKHQTIPSRLQSPSVDSPRMHHRSQSSSPGLGGRKRVAYTSLRAAAAAGAAAQAHAAQVAAASGTPRTPTRSGLGSFSFATAPSSDPSAATGGAAGSRRNSRDSSGRLQNSGVSQLPRQLSFGQRTASENANSGAMDGNSSPVGGNTVATNPDNTAAVAAASITGAPGRTRVLPALSINTSALSSSSVAAATSSAVPIVPSAALVASYGTKSSIAAFKKAYASKLSESQSQQPQPKPLRPSSRGAQHHDLLEEKMQPAQVNMSEPSSAVGDGVASPGGMASPGGVVLAEGDGPVPSPSSYGHVQPSYSSAAAPDSGSRSNSSRLMQQQYSQPAVPSSAIANGMSFLDPDSARNKGHARSRSRGYNPSAALQAHAAAAAGYSATNSTTATPASSAAAAPASSDSARQPGIDRAISVNSVVRQEQIQLLRSTLNAQQQEQQREKAARTPAAHTPGALSPPHSHSRNPSTGGALYLAPSDPAAGSDVSMLMTPENILNESNPAFHEHYKQWFREEIAAERAEAKRRIKQAAENGGRHYSPSRSLFTPERDVLFVTDDTDLYSLGCRTPGTPQADRFLGGARQCFTPGGTLLNLLVESNSRSATPAGGNTPGWQTPGGPGSPVAAWRFRQSHGEAKSPSQHHAPITISTSAAHTPNRGPIGGGGGAGSSAAPAQPAGTPSSGVGGTVIVTDGAAIGAS